MREWVDLEMCIGKTLAGVSTADDSRFVIAFSDESWTTVSIWRSRFPEESDSIESTRTEPIEVTHQLVRLGLMSEEEAEALRKEEREKRSVAERERDLAELNRLKAKLEGGG